jgi:diaminopimelate decarboxylase
MRRDLDDRRQRLRDCGALEKHGTPVYVFFEADLRANYRTLRGALDEHYPDSSVHFAVKANYNLGVLSVLRSTGCGAEAYARCELTAALEAGFAPGEVILTGMSRRQADLERAMDAGVDTFLVDNGTELDRVEAAAGATDATPEVLLRGNPAMEVPTHPEVATATRESKFGLDVESGRAMAVAHRAVASDRLELAGVQLHVGSQIRGTEPYAVAAREMLGFVARIREECGVEPGILDLGGGFPVPYDEPVPETEPIVATIADAVAEACREHDLERPTLYLEPGRRLVGNAGALLASVGLVKETPASTFAVLDAGTNAVSSYWPYPIYALKDGAASETYDVAGPLCYTGDVIREDVSLPPLSEGDAVAIDRIGAYSLGSASHINAEPKSPVVLVREDGRLETIRPGETCEDVLGADVVPDDLA